MEETIKQSQKVTPAGPAVADHAAYVGAIPENYHSGVGPFLFEPYAQELSARIAAFSPRRVLETACGTGLLTRRLREALPGEALLIATDLNEPMLAVAKRTVGPGANVQWAREDMTRLRSGSGEFDAVVCQFGIMFVPNKPAAAREALRVLKPGGRLLMATWRAVAENEAIRLAHETVSSLFPGELPQFYLTQTGHGDPQEITRLLVSAGFVDVQAEVVQKRSTITSMREVAVGLIEGFPIVDFIKARDPALVPVAVDTLTEALGKHFGQAPAEATISALVTSATAPDA
ncbi:class I SAM-dependent methyltransferase [Hyalangium sp.]|uniref:class I SAM-dependent methyltransferase n=1 Tax=Hyalangium sp. TaxID=2028555 RepID=UPI002D6D3FAB|nr:methyltransferase domain-containing protein [Hyalangium sp.]HYH97068.1 methyltransferase domain-containing protein [Hyalangium sp.]